MTAHADDLAVGTTFASRGRTITEADIVAFAGLTGDYNPLHTDETWVVQNTPFPSRIAHGLLVLSASSGLRTPGLDELHILAFLGVERRMRAPTFPGDTITQVQTVQSLRASSSQPGARVVTLAVVVTNQDGTVVQEGTDTLLVGEGA